jgi:hypothetical protein
LTDAAPAPTSAQSESGSFRDWDGRVFTLEGRIVRALSDEGVRNFLALSQSEMYRRSRSRGDLIETAIAAPELLAAVQEVDPRGGWVEAVTHDRLGFISYPYEWSFSMLRDAALLQLRLTMEALDEGLALKDASPFNVQWRGSRPVFIDVGSFERLRAGEPWQAYRQFCALFLYPLMLEAYLGIAFQPWLRGRLDGIEPTEFRKLLRWRDALRPGVLRHVFLHASLARRYADGASMRRELSDAGFDAGLIAKNVASLEKLVQRLHSELSVSDWQDYSTNCGYSERDVELKQRFVRRVLAHRRWDVVWDLGCNDGRYSRIASERAALTIAMDSEPSVIDGLYRALRDESDQTILPLVVDLADPSPASGWRNRERLTLESRGAPDLILCLALVHHLSITRNIPLREIVAWLASLGCEVVIEFPSRADELVVRLLSAKPGEPHPDYEQATFESLMKDRFEITDTCSLPSGTRTLYAARPR